MLTSREVITDVEDPVLTNSLALMFIRDAGNPTQQKFLLEFNRVKDNFKLMIKGFLDEQALNAKFTWVKINDIVEVDDHQKEIGRKNMLRDFLKDVKERVESYVEYTAKSGGRSTEDVYLEVKATMKKARLRFVQCTRITELTILKPNTTIEDRCSQMPQCILEALIVEIGMVADTEEFISAYSEALMLLLIYYRMVRDCNKTYIFYRIF